MEAVVLTDGTVGEVHVTQPLDPGLDEEAVKALKQWTFSPGTRDGKPVPVSVEIGMPFFTDASSTGGLTAGGKTWRRRYRAAAAPGGQAAVSA